jgi:hypothetical protein
MRGLVKFIRFCCANNKPPSNFTFQSKHYKPKVPVENFLMQHNIIYKATANGFTIRECPFCLKPHGNDPTNLFRLNVHRESGVYYCFRCASKGSWLNFRGKILGLLTENGVVDGNGNGDGRDGVPN